MGRLRQFARLIAASLLLVSAAEVLAGDHLRIASWNIENLGSRSPEHEYLALAEHIRLAGCDILALQEVHDTDRDDATRTNGILSGALKAVSEADGQDWEYILFANKRSSDRKQLCGIAWNSARVTPDDQPPLRIAFPDEVVESDLWWRHPHAMKFSAGHGKTDFVLIVLHMKSNVDGVAAGREQRADEAAALVAVLPDVRRHFEDDDIVLLGDTNCKETGEDALRTFSAAGFRDLNAADANTYCGRRSPFDRILVPRDEPEFRFCRQYVLLSCDAEAHDEYLSDHFLVQAAFRVEGDDPHEGGG